MKVELFLADCKLCERMENMVRTLFPHFEVEVHRAAECRDGSCCIRAAEVGVRAVPSLVVDGRVVQMGLPTEKEVGRLKQLFGLQ